MDAFVITLLGNPSSKRMAERCIASANLPILMFPATTPTTVDLAMNIRDLHWTWGKGYQHMQHKPYGGDDAARRACFMSHYRLWEYCAACSEPVLILEHDAYFVRPFEPFEFQSICMINDPANATPKGVWWSQQMAERGPGVWPKTPVFDDSRPDGLAGNSAYVIKPEAARRLLELTREVGAWPNDALICRQFFPDLEECYPFVTEVRSEGSTIQ